MDAGARWPAGPRRLMSAAGRSRNEGLGMAMEQAESPRSTVMAPERTGIGISRYFTSEGSHPYDAVTWERRDARITNYKDGSVAFEQLGVEVPSTWSLNATNILAQKYF